MSTISNERLEEMRDYDTCVRLDESAAMATELLALRKERERAEPVYQCMDDGKWYDTEKRLYDEVKENGNECRVLYTAPPAPVVADDSLQYDPQIAEYEQMMEAEQAQADTTSQQCESLAGKAVSGWIPCSERLPDLKQEILCVNQWGEVEAAIYDVGYIPGEPFFATSAGEFYPTHWHALPELPCK